MHTVLRAAALAPVIALLLASGVRAGSEREDAAVEAARSWLAVVDAGDFGGSHARAADAFRTQVSAPQWEASLRSVRTPFGRLASRELRSATWTRSLPGAPAGEYVVIQFDAVFEGSRRALETVTPMLEAGTWKVAGYFIKPE